MLPLTFRHGMHSMRSQHNKDVKYFKELLNYSNANGATKTVNENCSSGYKGKDVEDSKYNPLFKNWAPIGTISNFI